MAPLLAPVKITGNAVIVIIKMELANTIRVSSEVACVHLIGNSISLEMALIYVSVLRHIVKHPKQCLVTGMLS